MHNDIRIAIVGGGPGGLTLARLLATRGLSATVFERDAHAAARPQGGSLDLHVESGQRALVEAGLEAQFRHVARWEDQEVRLYDRDGTLLFEERDAAAGDRPEVDRAALRDLLLASLPAGTVRWGQKVRAVEPAAGGGYTLVGATGAPETFDLVVGPHRPGSRVRPLVSSAQPLYSGVTFVELCIADADRRQPALAARVGRGKLFALGEAKGIVAQRNDHGIIRVYVCFRAPEDWLASAVDLSDPARARADLARQLAGWAPALTDFITRADGEVTARPLVALPVGHRWQPRAGVTLLGDAAHVMSPFTGEGVNIAMRDATELALALAGAGADWRAAVAGYEAELFARAEVEAGAAAAALESAISTAAPQSFLADLHAIQAQAAAAARC
jgi:2-polyprenyl-6-methoxyphenol hydroxylase-like FAD-dependent oxidoreductase